MKTTVFLLAGVCAMALGGVAPSAQFNLTYGNVKAWKGTVTVEAASTNKAAVDDITTTVSYSATGPVTLSDDMMPDGAHQQWPVPSSSLDPARYMEAFKRWPTRIVFRSRSQGKTNLGEPYSEACAADEARTATVKLTAVQMAGTWELEVEPPAVEGAQCKGTNVPHATKYSVPGTLRVTGKMGKAPGPLAGTQKFTVGEATVTVTYALTPAS